MTKHVPLGAACYKLRLNFEDHTNNFMLLFPFPDLGIKLKGM